MVLIWLIINCHKTELRDDHGSLHAKTLRYFLNSGDGFCVFTYTLENESGA